MVSNILKENQNLALRCVAFIIIQVKADTGQVMMQLDQMVSEKFYSTTTRLEFVPASYIQCQLQMACTDEHSCVQPGNKIWFVCLFVYSTTVSDFLYDDNNNGSQS